MEGYQGHNSIIMPDSITCYGCLSYALSQNSESISVIRNLLSTECLSVFRFTSIVFPDLCFVILSYGKS